MGAAPPSHDFDRALGPWSAGALAAGSMIGTGIFFFVSPVAEQLASPPAIIAAWSVGAMVAAAGALCVAELASSYPRAGGTYAFFLEAFGPFVAFLYSWASFAVMRVGNVAIFALAFSSFAAAFFGAPAAAVSAGSKPLALAAIAAITVVNAAGVRFGGALQNAFTLLKLLSLLAVLAVGAAFATGMLAPHVIEVAPHRYSEGFGISAFLAALIPVLWTFGGWDEPAFVAEEIRAPERNLPRAILGGLLLVAILYVLVNVAYLAILTPAELAGSGNATATLALGRALGAPTTRALALVLMISTLGVANGMIMTGARIAYATGKDQRMFGWLATTNEHTKVPMRALVVQALLVGTAIVAMPDPFLLLLYTGVAYWGFAALTAVATLVLRGRDQGEAGGFRAGRLPLVPLLFLAASLAMVVAVVREAPHHAAAAALILGVGACLFAVQRGRYG